MEILEKGQYKNYLSFCETSGAHFMQTPLWAGVKRGWESDVLVKREQGEICAGILLLRRKIPGTLFCMIYAPRGPVCQRQYLEELMQDVIGYAQEKRACCLKIDPPVPAVDAEYEKSLARMGFLKQPAGAMGNTQPKFVYQIDIADKEPAQILQNFTPKTRYNTRVAKRKGVQIWQGGSQRLEEFYRLLVETGKRDGFAVRQQAYYQNLLNQMGPHAQLFLADYEGKAIAGAIAIWFGEKTWYLYGASSRLNREAMPNYLVQYTVMLWAAEKGCKIYDMRGISGDFSPNSPCYGLYRFKRGFGGYVREYIGEYERPIYRCAYACYRAALKVRGWQKRRLLRKFQRGCLPDKKRGKNPDCNFSS